MRLKHADFAAFIAVARHKSFRAAGDELGLSASAVSHAIKQLEQRLKIQVFNRTTRSVSLTEAGENLYVRLRPAFDEIDTMLDEVNSYRTTPMGTLKINTSPLFSRLVLVPLVAGFVRQYPDIKVEITTDDKLVDIVKQNFDAGIRLSTALENDMIAVPIGPKIKIAVAATPKYFAHHAPPVDPRELSTHQCIVFRLQTGRPYLWEFEGPEGKVEIAPSGNIVLDDLDSALEAALCGAGVGYLNYYQAKPYLESGKLVSVLESWLPERPHLQLYYPRSQYMSCSLRAFLDFIKSTPQ
jgi:DNA-binding transcriptional LysR family regulator